MNGNAFIAFHGSWNRNPPTGYKVVRVPMGDNGNPTVDEAIDFFCHHDKSGSGAKWPNGFRPVDVVFDKCNRLLITSDGTGSASTRKGNGIVIVTQPLSSVTMCHATITCFASLRFLEVDQLYTSCLISRI